MYGTGGGGVVDEQNGRHDVVVGPLRLHRARDGVVRDEVLDRVLRVKEYISVITDKKVHVTLAIY